MIGCCHIYKRLFYKYVTLTKKSPDPVLESEDCLYCVVRTTGLEPARGEPMDPKSIAATNYAMSACLFSFLSVKLMIMDYEEAHKQFNNLFKNVACFERICPLKKDLFFRQALIFYNIHISLSTEIHKKYPGAMLQGM